MEYPGKFIVFEGIDGSGKTTQIELLAKYLRDKGHDVEVVREPGGTSISEKIRHLILDPSNKEMHPMCELLLFEASRAQLVNETIIPALKRGAIVLCDRYIDSTVAYQVGCRGQNIGKVTSANLLAMNDVGPDLVYWLAVSTDTAIKRCGESSDRMEQTVELDKARAQYQILYRYAPHVVVVDGELNQHELANKIAKATSEYLQHGRTRRTIG